MAVIIWIASVIDIQRPLSSWRWLRLTFRILEAESERRDAERHPLGRVACSATCEQLIPNPETPPPASCPADINSKVKKDPYTCQCFCYPSRAHPILQDKTFLISRDKVWRLWPHISHMAPEPLKKKTSWPRFRTTRGTSSPYLHDSI